MAENTCPFCRLHTDTPGTDPQAHNTLLYDCPNCGRYSIDRRLLLVWSFSSEERAKLSYVIRLVHDSGEEVRVTEDWRDKTLTKTILPSPPRQIDTLLKYLGKAQEPGGPGIYVRIEPNNLRATIGSVNKAGVDYARDSLLKSSLIECHVVMVNGPKGELVPQPESNRIRLTSTGWMRYEELTDGAHAHATQQEPKPTMTADSESIGTGPVRVFISHSSADRELAERITRLFRLAMNLHPGSIRCTSVDGHRLPGGVDTSDTLKREIVEAEVFIGLISQSSNESAYVLFELGARWGASKILMPVLAPGMSFADMKGPISDVNAFSVTDEGQLHALLSSVREKLGVQLVDTSAYLRDINELASLRGESVADTTPQFKNDAVPIETSLTEDEKEYLHVIAQPEQGGQIHRALLEAFTGRETEIYRTMLDKFESLDLVRNESDRWVMTLSGYDVAEKISSPTIQPSLSTEARGLLAEASSDKKGTVLIARTLQGIFVQTNGRQFAEPGNPRSEAQWVAVVKELVDSGVLEERGQKGEVFAITNSGYEMADQLKQRL